jgi:hypothetical protein
VGRHISWTAWASFYVLLGVGACAHPVGKDPLAGKLGDGGTASSSGSSSGSGGSKAGAKGSAGSKGSGLFGNAPSGTGSTIARDAEVTADAFFVSDPAPPMCGQNGTMSTPVQPGGTLECPEDKNREGCPCPTLDMTAACWPGKRGNRNHGICKDGTTKCVQTGEFGPRWGPCDGYVLPDPSATAGPQACGCFSSGTWKLTNLAPCIFRGSATYLYSSKLTADNKIDCGTNVPDPPPVPPGVWTDDTLNVDCGGQFKLCYTIKAGDVNNPKPGDCVITQWCTDVWYPMAGVDQRLPDVPGWRTSDAACAKQFDQGGGYGEMSVIGKSAECDVVDDGHGNPYVFHRTDYCPPSCQNTPTAPGCKECQTGGSGMFGP